MHFQQQDHDIWKSSLELNPLMQNNFQEDYLLELHPITPLPLPKHLWETLGMGDGEESHPTTKNLLISPTRKIPLNKFTSSFIKNGFPSPSNSNFHLITLYKLHLGL